MSSSVSAGPNRAALEQALVAVEAARSALLAALDIAPDPRLGSKEAAAVWGVTESAALKRLYRIGSRDGDGRWRAPLSVIEGMFRPDAGR